MSSPKLSGWLGWLSAAGAGLLLTAVPAPAQTFGGATDVVEVEVPVQVVRDGEPVRGLTAADFEVYDGRKKQEVTGFHAVDLAAAGAQRASAVPLAGRRQFLLLFDLAFSDPKSVVKARDAARELVIKGLKAGDLVGLATYGARGPQLVLGFTSDRRQVDSALDTLGMVRAERPDDPLRLVMARSAGGGKGGGQPQVAERSQEADAAHVDTLLTDLGPQQANLGRESNRASQRAVVTALTRAYSEFARMLGAVPGRKQILLFSEGFDSSLLTGSPGPAPGERLGDSPALGTLTAPGVGTSEPHLESSDDTYGNSTALNDLEKMLEEFRRADCVIQAIDLGGLRAGGEQQVARTSGKDSLFAMARGTGGELFEGSNDLSAAMSGVVGRTSLTYVLSFAPEKQKPDGSYHRLRVELKNAPRGTRVAYRAGYYAPRPYNLLNPMEKLFDASSRLMGGAESGSIASAVMAAPFRGAGGGDAKAYVPVLIEVDGPALLVGKPQGALPVEVYVYALGADGSIQDFLFQTLGLDLAKVEPSLRQGGLKFFGHLDLPAGDYSLRTLVRNGATGAYSLRALPLTVPAAQGAALLPPLFPDLAANRWLTVRETQRGPEVPYPFMARKQPYVPASRPALAAGQEVPLALVGYDLAAGDLKARARVLSADGKEAGTGQIRVLEREAGGGGPDRLTAAFKPPQLAPGEYTLEVTLTSAGVAAGTSSAPFLVRGAGVGGGR
jgi:VWFA-related protein